MDKLRNALRRPAGLVPDLVELSGLAAIVYAVALVCAPAAFGVGGLLAVLYANVHDPRRSR